MAVIEVVGCGYRQTNADAPTRLHLTVRYGQNEVIIPLNGVYVAGDGPYEEVLTSCQSAEDLAAALLLWSREKRRSLDNQ